MRPVYARSTGTGKSLKPSIASPGPSGRLLPDLLPNSAAQAGTSRNGDLVPAADSQV